MSTEKAVPRQMSVMLQIDPEGSDECRKQRIEKVWEILRSAREEIEKNVPGLLISQEDLSNATNGAFTRIYLRMSLDSENELDEESFERVNSALKQHLQERGIISQVSFCANKSSLLHW